MANVNENAVQVSDLGLASLLVTLGVELLDTERNASDPKRIHFRFASSLEVEAMIKAYWADQTIAIPVQTLFTNHKKLKNRLYGMPQ